LDSAWDWLLDACPFSAPPAPTGQATAISPCEAVVMLEGDELDEHQPMEYLDMAPWALGAGCNLKPQPGSIGTRSLS